MNYRRHFLIGVVTALLLGFFGLSVQAHDPHDVVRQVELSPNYSQDHALYLLVRGNFLKSVDEGVTWQRQVQGLDHQTPLTAFAIAPTAPDHLYITTEGDGLYESENAGKTWQSVNQELPELALTQVAVSATDANRVYVAGHDSNVYRRDGDTWSLALATKVPVGAIATSPDQIVIGDYQGNLYRSGDAGQTWTTINVVDGAITSVNLSPDNDTFWIGTETSGILRTTDGGQTFTAVNEGLPETTIQDIVSATDPNTQLLSLYASTSNNGVFYSTNRGDSWRPVDDGLTKTSQADKMGYAHFTDLAISPAFNQDGTVLASGFNGLFKTTNQGETWAQLDTLPGDIPMALALSPNYATDKTVVAVTYVGEAYMSNDGGDSWSPMAKGLELPFFTDTFEPIERNDDPRRFQSLAFSPNYAKDKTLFATILNNGVLRYSESNGWQLQRFKGWERALAIAPSPNYDKDHTVFVGTQEGRVYLSQNSGKSFKKLGEIGRQVGNESPFMVVSPNYAQDKTVFMTGAEGVYKTTDAGQSWQAMTSKEQIQDRSKLKLAVSPNYGQDQTLWLGTSDGLFETQDGGETWNLVSSNVYGAIPYIEAVAISPSYANDQTLFVSVRGKGLIKSTDSGRTFAAVGNATPPLSIVNNFEYGSMPLVISPNYAKDQTLFGIGAVTGDIFKSTDGGENWATITLPNAEIFTAYNNYQYSPISKVRFFVHIYQRQLLKMGLACLSGMMCYALLSTVTQFIRRTPWLRRPMRLGAATVVTGLAIAVLFV
ncbi:MAG: glycosyl hydrolase [Cyanobacteria bacterium P01_D01_bin.156]